MITRGGEIEDIISVESSLVFSSPNHRTLLLNGYEATEDEPQPFRDNV